jgi:large subunit ribosomal protein L24
MWVRVGDTVEVTAGDDRGVQAKVKAVDHDASKVTVEGVNRVYKHVRRSQRNPQGGRLSMEMPVRMSNVAVICSKCGKAARMGARYLADGAKERFCKKCGSANGEISPAKARYAKKS